MKIITLPALILLPAVITAAETPNPTSTAVRWVAKSQEYKAVCQQTYATAMEKVEAAAKVSTGSWAIVMDIDETVLSNVRYQIELNARSASHSQKAWEAWVARSEAGPVPSAKDFILRLRALPRGRIIFLSNRFARGMEATRRNLRKHGLTTANDVFLLRKNREDTKANRRNEVISGTGRMASHGTLRVLAWFGDAAHDFPDDDKLKWGTHKFMLPNPVYGGW